MRNQLTRRASKANRSHSTGKRQSANADNNQADLTLAQSLTQSRVALCISAMCLAGASNAQPSGAEVVHGTASFIQQGRQLNIQNSNGAIINWQDFSIAQSEAVRFLQSGVDSSVLNRVVSGIPSEILGSLSSNGRVFLINPNGLVIGEGASIDTAAFIASTLSISDADFKRGNLRFAGDGAPLENHGYIAAAANGEVVLIAPSIENHGLIKADDGKILLAAGREVVLHSLQQGGISYRVSAPQDSVLNVGELVASNGSVKVFADQIFQQGAVSATRAHRAADGSIVLQADQQLHVSGQLSVAGEQADAGQLHLLGRQVDVTNAQLNADGESGGEILIGGDYQGKGSVPNALNTNLDAATQISANAAQHGDGGRVIIWSDDTTNSYASISARGGQQSGDGGFVETSGKRVLDFGPAVDVSATNGAAGTWLLDPEDILIDEGHAEAISTSLNGGSNVEVKTSDAGDGDGNITVAAPITKTEGDAAVTLTLDAHNRVDVNAPITTSAGPLNLTIKTGRQVTAIDTVEEDVPGQPAPDLPDDNNAPEEAVENNSEVAIEEDQEPALESEEASSDPQAEEGDELLSDVAVNDEPDTPLEQEGQSLDAIKPDDPSEQLDSDSSELAQSSDDTGQTSELNAAPSDQAPAPEDSEADAALAQTEQAESPDDLAETSAGEADPDSSPDAVTDALTDAVTDPVTESEVDAFIDLAEQQVVIASDIFTGGGALALDAGDNGDAIVAADILSTSGDGEFAGDIRITGARVAVVDQASIDASAEQAGEILIGGGQQGQDSSIDNAQAVLLTDGTSVSANGGTKGDGGRVIVFAEQTSVVSGDLSARGGTESGDGGFIETSGLINLSVSGTPNAGANNGDGGTWLIDPLNIRITNTESSSNTNVDDTSPSDGWGQVMGTSPGAQISEAELTRALQYGDVSITTSNSSFGEDGDITIETGIRPSDNAPSFSSVLTLQADRDILVNYYVDFSGHDVNLVFNAGRNITVDGTVPDTPNQEFFTDGEISLTANDNIVSHASISGSRVNLTATNGSVTLDDPSNDGRSIRADYFDYGGPAGLDIEAGQDITVEQNIYSNSAVSLQAGGDITVEDRIQAESYVELGADNDVNVHASIRAYGEINLNADVDGVDGGTVLIENRVERYGIGLSSSSSAPLDAINITGDQVDINSIGCDSGECSNSVRLTAIDINIGLEDSEISGDVKVFANGDITNDYLSYGGNVYIKSYNALNIRSAGAVTFEAAATQQFSPTANNGYGAIINHQRYNAYSYSTYDNANFSNRVLVETGGEQNITAQSLSLITNAGERSRVLVKAEGEYNKYTNGGEASQSITVDNLNIDSSGEIRFETASQGVIRLGGNAVLSSSDQQNIDVAQDIRLTGHANNSASVSANDPNSVFSSVITAYGQQTIDADGALVLDNGEITTLAPDEVGAGQGGFPPFTNVILGDNAGPGESAFAVNAPSTITVGAMGVSQGLISQQRDAATDSSTLTLTVENNTSISGPDASFSLPGNFGLRLESVNWLQQGDLQWGSGNVELDVGSVDGSSTLTGPNSTMLLSGTFSANSENGAFSFINDNESTGTIDNTGTIAKDFGSGSTYLRANVTNTGRIVGYSGTLNFGGEQGIIQTAGSTELRGGNISVGEFTSTGGSIEGGYGDYQYSSGGTLTSDVTVQGTQINPGFSPGTITIDGDFDASGGGNTFNIEVYADSYAQDLLDITGVATIPFTGGAGLNQVYADATGYFNSPAYSPQFTVISSGSGTIDNLYTQHFVEDPNVEGFEFIDGDGNFVLEYQQVVIVDPEPPVVDPEPPENPEPPATPDTPEQPPEPPMMSDAPDQPEPPAPIEPEVIIVIIDDQPLALPPEVVDVLVTLSDEEKTAYLESERVKRYLKTVNMCVASV